MTNKDNGGPAFPLDYETTTAIHGTSFADAAQGMTLHDYFAAKAMQGMVSSMTDEDGYDRFRAHADAQGLSVSQWIARDSYKQADAMLEARK